MGLLLYIEAEALGGRPVGPAQPSAELSVTHLALLPFQDAILAQPAGAPVARSRGTVPRASKQLAQVRARSSSPAPKEDLGLRCGRHGRATSFQWRGTGFPLLASFEGEDVVCSVVGLGTSQNTLTTAYSGHFGWALTWYQASPEVANK